MGWWPVAKLAWREAARDRWLAASVVAMLCLSGLLHLAEAGGPGQGRAALDLGAKLMLALADGLALHLASQAIPDELERRTAYVVLAKPLGRWAFLAGKYLGLMWTLAASWCLMTTVWFAFAWWDGVFQPSLALLSGVLFAQVACVAAMALAFGANTHRHLALGYTLGLLALGQLGTLIREFAVSEALLNPFHHWGGLALAALLPHFELFDLVGFFAYGTMVPWWPACWAIAYAVCLSTVCLTLGAWGWQSRELP